MTKRFEWTHENTQKLEKLWLDGLTYEAIGFELGCTAKAIAHKLRTFASVKQSIWTPERTERLAQWASEGRALSKIAELISDELGYKISRSSIAGRCARTGITIQSFEANARRQRLRRAHDLATGEARLAAVVKETPPHDSLRSVGQETGEEESVAASPVFIEELFDDVAVCSPRVTIIELSNLMCHWVTAPGVADVLPGYCGEAVVFKDSGLPSVYCREHHSRAYYLAPKMTRSVAV